MDADTLRAFTLKAREILIGEVEDQLEGIYGLLSDGHFEPAAGYPVLAEIPECAETRQRLETFMDDEVAAGLDREAARRKLAKEAAFTWLNRLVAFKMMETRKLIRQTVTKGADSNGFKMWLTEDGNEQHLTDYEAGEMPKDARGEGPRDRAYRRFLLAQCGRLAEEIRVLFDPDNLASQLALRPTILAQLIDSMNDGKLAEAWEPGNEETIGWVYQFFIEEEKADVFDRLYKKKQKIRREDVPASTQIFTPRWIVKSLVQNTLGRHWLQMHPDSTLAEKLDYLVPLEGEIPAVPLKSVSEITLLDPACGTMHFGLVAFDLFVEMYREELDRAGEEGWPEEPSAKTEEDIPATIVANNLHGIDIDLRAVQLSALTLFVKAKMVNKKCRITDTGLACTDTRMILGDRFQEFLDKLGRPIYRRILTALAKRLEHADQLGSLLRPDEDVRTLIEQERKKYEKEGRQPDLFGWSREQFDTEAGRREFWETREAQIAQAIEAFARDETEAGHDASFFVGEATKGLRMLDLLAQRYDVVLTNPPYMTQRSMNQVMKGYLRKEFPASKPDMYAAFIQRCSELSCEEGRIGMITQQSFMFTSSYESLRHLLRDRVAIETMPHVGPRAFGEVSGEKVNTTLLAFRLDDRKAAQEEAFGTYFRLVREPDADSKRSRFAHALAHLRARQPDPIVYRYRQADFDAIPGSPWVYWTPLFIRKMFQELRSLSSIGDSVTGINTGDNFRFRRYWWEKPIRLNGKWNRYVSGGEYLKWYGNLDYVVNMDTDAMAPLHGSALRARDYWLRGGITYCLLSSKGFNARLLPEGYIFSSGGNCTFLYDGNSVKQVLGILNSSLANYLLQLINPTINFPVGCVGSLPIPTGTSKRLAGLVDEAITLAKADCSCHETTYDFVAPPGWPSGCHDIAAQHARLADCEREIENEVWRLYGVQDADRGILQAEMAENLIVDDSGEVDGAGGLEEPPEGRAEDTNAVARDELAQRWISYAVGVVLGRFRPGVESALGCSRFSDDVGSRLRAVADTDGIVVQDEGHPDDLASRTLAALRVMLGDDAAREVVLTATGKTGETEPVLQKYLEGPFLKEHIKLYRKRPVYWLLQSPKKKYGVWVFHERLTSDSLYRIQREYVDPKTSLLEGQLGELRKKRDAAAGRERRGLEKEMATIEDVLADVREFAARINTIIQRGYAPHIDDGVLLNMAPLWELIPSWQAEPKKAWKALESGDYDWAQHAMDYWPDRVREKCRENKSYAIAHGLA